jgi:hypothetical protein
MNSLNWLQLSLAVLQAAPGIINAIKSTEQAIVGPRQGANRKAVVMSAFRNAPPVLASAVSQYIDDTVDTMNKAGALDVSSDPLVVAAGALDAVAAANTTAQAQLDTAAKIALPTPGTLAAGAALPHYGDPSNPHPEVMAR